MHKPDEEQEHLRNASACPGDTRIYELPIVVDQNASYKTFDKIVNDILPGCEYKIKGPEMTKSAQGEEVLPYTIYATLESARLVKQRRRRCST